MNNRVSFLVATSLCIVLFAVGCVTMQKRWEIAKSEDTILAYEEFLQKHPDSEFAGQARTRLEELYLQRDWRSARLKDTISAYEEFLEKYPDGELAGQARTRLEELYAHRDWINTISLNTNRAYKEFLQKHPDGVFENQARTRLEEFAQQDWRPTRLKDTISAYKEFLRKHPDGELADQARSRVEAMRKDKGLRDWEKALKKNTIWAYANFLKKNPKSLFADKAKGKIVDLEVSDILSRPHGQLPSANRVSGGGGRTYSVVNIHNDTSYNLTIRYSGQESFKVIFSPDEKGSIEYLRGMYRVAASVDAANVRDYAGEERSDGGNYEVEYYIRGPFGEYRYQAPQIYFGSAPNFEAWKCKKECRTI